MQKQLAIEKVCPEISPILVQDGVERTGTEDIPGEYCCETHVWLVDGRPIVKAKSELAELTTKTEAQIERDDTSEFSLLEMQTKTLSNIERDDQDWNVELLELATKTESFSERDD